MEHFLFLLVCGLIADITGGIYIDNCSLNNPLEIQENADNTIVCKGARDDETLTWSVQWTDAPTFATIATCTLSSCTLHLPGQFTAQRSRQVSRLVYKQQDRAKALKAIIRCVATRPDGRTSIKPCWFNLISHAVLSGCAVEEDRANKTMRGRCYFQRAFSSKRRFTCNWLRNDFFIVTGHAGVIKNRETYTVNGEAFERGQCDGFAENLRWETNKNYSYMIVFYPGSGLTPVPLGTVGPESTTHRQEPEQTTVNDDDRPTPKPEEDSAPVAAVASWTTAGVVFAAGVVFIVVFVVLRRRRTPAGSDRPDSTNLSDDYWEEHVNPAYVSYIAPDASLQSPGDHQQSDPNRNGTAPGNNPASDVYAVVKKPSNRTDPNRNETAPGNNPASDVYAVVKKPSNRTDPNRNGTAPGNNPASDVYAVVKKPPTRTDPNRNGTVPVVVETYAVVHKSRKNPAPSMNGPADDSKADDSREAEPEGLSSSSQ